MLNITMGLDVNTNIMLTENLEALTLQNMSLELLESETTVENNIDYLIAENDKKSKELFLNYLNNNKKVGNYLYTLF